MYKIANLRATHTLVLKGPKYKMGWRIPRVMHANTLCTCQGHKHFGITKKSPATTGLAAAAHLYAALGARPPQLNSAQFSLQLKRVTPFVAADKRRSYLLLMQWRKATSFLHRAHADTCSTVTLPTIWPQVPVRGCTRSCGKAEGGSAVPVWVHTWLSDPMMGNSDSIPSRNPGCHTSRLMAFIAFSSWRQFILAALFQAAHIHRSLHPQQMKGWFTASVLGTASQQGCMCALQFKYFGTAQSEMHKMLMYY